MRRLTLIGAALTALSLVVGCSSGTESSRKGPEYGKADTLPPLEVPPDLTSPVERGNTSLPEISSGQSSRVLSAKRNVLVKGKGDQRWLQIDTAPEDVWEQVREFWLKNGFELNIDEPDIGIMETKWAENRAERPENFISKWLGGLYSASTRDKFRVRLERTDNDETELYLTHYGIKQVVVEEQVGGNDDIDWQPRPSDPELAQEMLKRIMAYLGVDAEATGSMLANADEEPSRAELVKAGSEPEVVVYEGFARAWRRTGIALDRIGFVVEDRNRSQGIYYVRYVDQLADAGKKNDEEGWFSGLFSGGDDGDESVKDGQKMHVVVRGDDRQTRIALRSVEDKPADPNHAEIVLDRLVQQLR